MKKPRPYRGVTIHEARRLREGNPTAEELADFFERREMFLKRHKGTIGDFLEYSPMQIRQEWTR